MKVCIHHDHIQPESDLSTPESGAELEKSQQNLDEETQSQGSCGSSVVGRSLTDIFIV